MNSITCNSNNISYKIHKQEYRMSEVQHKLDNSAQWNVYISLEGFNLTRVGGLGGQTHFLFGKDIGGLHQKVRPWLEMDSVNLPENYVGSYKSVGAPPWWKSEKHEHLLLP